MSKRDKAKMCSRKTRYKTRNDAKKVKINIKRWDNTIMRIYECPYCSGYHLTFDKEKNDVEKRKVGKKVKR